MGRLIDTPDKPGPASYRNYEIPDESRAREAARDRDVQPEP
jgi:hypothetical protein